MGLSTSTLPTNITELKKTLSGINKNEKYDDIYKKGIMYKELGKLWEIDPALIIEFFSTMKYTGQHTTFAAFLYAIYGIEIYKRIHSIFSQNSDKRNILWDDFMLSQIKKYGIIHYGQQCYAHYYEGYSFRIEKLLYELKQICDDDLYVEMMCKLVRTYELESNFSAKDYEINYEYFLRRIRVCF